VVKILPILLISVNPVLIRILIYLLGFKMKAAGLRGQGNGLLNPGAPGGKKALPQTCPA
jgi:hypothetical protein